MKNIISINYKFMSLTPKRLVELISNSKSTKGVEIYINFNNKEELKYLDNLVIELKQNNIILQIHGEENLSIDNQLEYLKKIEEYSNYLNYPITYTLHPIYDEDKNISIEKTNKYIKEITNKIDNNKIVICLENLNDMDNKKRLKKEDIKDIIINNNIYFTYDIGHELVDNKKVLDIDNNLVEKTRNIHIHTCNDEMHHLPIYKNDIYLKELFKGIKNLNNYKYNIVYEYGLDYFNGNTIEEKINNYLEAIDIFNEILLFML